jgi:Zn-dependent metalloprotease
MQSRQRSRQPRKGVVVVCNACSIYCIVPPVVFEQIAKNGSREQREWAIETVSRDNSLRAARLHNSLVTGDAPIRGDFLAAADPGKPKRTVYDAKNQEQVTGEVVRAEGGPAVGDESADEAFDGLGSTYSLWYDVYQRDSIDDAGMPLNAFVHYGNRYDNAFWDGQQMVFGDGDGQMFNRFTVALDIIGHELAHGVVQTTANLNYWQQPGALNEHVADVFGSLVKQHKEGQSAEQADWLIGAGLFTDQVQGTEGRPAALRSMAAPGTAFDDDVLGKDPQPDHMDRFLQTTQDNGGVHINSGIPNKAFHTVAMELGGNAWEKAGTIWYSALRDPRVKATARFLTFAKATGRAANRLYGDGSPEAKTVANGWKAVGIEI